MRNFKKSNEKRCQELDCKFYDDSGSMARCNIINKAVEYPENSTCCRFNERLLPKKCPYYIQY